MILQFGGVSIEVHTVSISNAVGDAGLSYPGCGIAWVQGLGYGECLVGQLEIKAHVLTHVQCMSVCVCLLYASRSQRLTLMFPCWRYRAPRLVHAMPFCRGTQIHCIPEYSGACSTRKDSCQMYFRVLLLDIVSLLTHTHDYNHTMGSSIHKNCGSDNSTAMHVSTTW